MRIELSDYSDVKARARDLALNIPAGLALIPANFLDATSRDELLQNDHTPTIRSLWRQSGIAETKFEREDDHLGQKAERGFEEWIAPAIFVGVSLWSQNPLAVTIAINVISNYLTTLFQGLPFKTVKLEIVVEVNKDGTYYRKVNYSGDPSGLEKLPPIIRAVSEGKEIEGAENGK